MTLNKISKAFFINLDRRKDRLEHIEKNLPFSAERFSAVDARNTKLSEEVKKLFPKTWQKRTKAEICCAISHYRLWKKLVEDKFSDNFLILEDDVVFNERFVDFWNKVFSLNVPLNYNLIYLGGCQPWNKPHYHKVLVRYNDYFCNVKKNNYFTKNDHFWHMNASSYILSKNAASILCQWVDQKGMDDAVDNFMQKFFNQNKLFSAPKSIYHLNPLMACQLHEENNNTEIDKNSDIRYSEAKFNDDKKISVIIPTVWMANDYMMRSLLSLDKVDCIEEVIVIDNDRAKTPGWINAFKKVKLVHSRKRMYFNESVNFGIDLCKNDICCIYNDDITSDTRVFDYVKNNFSEKDGCIFISPDYINEKTKSSGNLKAVSDIIEDRLHKGSGMMMFLRKQNFIKIPMELVHHFGDTFIFEINKRQDKQNYIVEGFPIETPGSASEDDVVKKIISQDWVAHKQVFADLNKFLVNKEMTFPLLKEVSGRQIPKKIHLSWKNKNILDSNYELIRKGAKNLELLNPEWDIQVYDDEDVDRLLRDSVGRDNWNLIKDRKITEKTDLWRLLKTYKEGGLYIDIDRYIDTPLSEIIDHKTSCVLPTFQDVDFSQDFILTCAKNPIIGRAIANNLNYRKQGKPLFFLAVYSYMQSVCEVLGEKVVDRGNNTEYFNSIRNKINQCEYLETYREIGPEHHILFRNINSDFSMQQFEQDKADFYNGCNVIHWNNDTRKKHELISLQPRQELDIKEYYKKLDQKFIFEGGENSVENKSQAKKLIELCNKYNCKNVMEIGFNAGHSADLFLSINENIKLTSFDIGLHKYVNYGKKFIDNKYPNRHSLILGDSKKTIPEFYKDNSSTKFDLIFIDGDHSEIGAISDLFNCKELSHSETIVVMDDTRNEQPMASWNINVNKAWQKCISAGIVYQIESEDYNQEGFCARGQSWGRYILKEEKKNNANLKTKQQQFMQLKDQWQEFKDYDFLKYISGKLPKSEIPEDKFSKYNPGQKIAIVSLYTSEISDYAVCSEMSVRDYCLKQGYTFYVYREPLEKNASANWSKAKAILNHIDDHEYIVWMDSDTLIFNTEKKFESIIEKAPRKFILATKDIGDHCMLNSGVLFFKSHQYTKNLIQKWRDFNGDKSSLYASGGDQEILCEILRKSDGFGFNRKIFEMNEFNTDPRLVDNDTFILHFMAYPYELKKIFMGYWNQH